jgi:hypothetical protein
VVDQPQTPVASDGLPARESGAWVLEKRVYVEKYLGIFTKGVGKKWGRVPHPSTPPKRWQLNFRVPHSSRLCFMRRVGV